ncbi:MAG: hypothetical protein V5A45_07005 [Haloarculaceae archaeon]|jgi:fructoselysine-6-P-deglycase FrlB-like protein|uniref:DUF7556 family protein n=1 Tax=Salinibaculum rarum TaxID=3058903 RepID=UPI00265FC27D|nr:hypothetical protein [Salinibaculum sp. KK48]
MTDTVNAFGRQSGESDDVVSAVDTIDGGRHLVVADITRDDAWLAMDSARTVSLDEWR